LVQSIERTVKNSKSFTVAVPRSTISGEQNHWTGDKCQNAPNLVVLDFGSTPDMTSPF
jgi:hypothetical protein